MRHCFDPSLQPAFSGQICAAALNCRQDSRYLFYALLHASEHYEVLPLAYYFLKQHLHEVSQQYASRISQHYQPETITKVLTPPVYLSQVDETNPHNHLRQCAPVILTEPCWLRAVSQACTSQIPVAVKLMSVYLQLSQDDSYQRLYRAWLLAMGWEQPAFHSWAFAQQAAISDCSFGFAAIQLALAYFPRVFFPELLGFTLAYCQAPAQTGYFLATEKQQNHDIPANFILLRKNLPASQLPVVLEASQDYLRLFAGQADVLWPRMQTGFWLYQEHNQRCFRHGQQSESGLSPAQAMAKLLQQKASAAFGHHGKILLGGKSLDDWFAQANFDSKNFLTALRQSSYVDKQNPADSPLLKLFDFNGPMFGVLNKAEKDIVKNWLCTEGADNLIQNPPVAIETNDTARLKIDRIECPSIDYARLDNRELYHYLVNVDLFPDVLAAAKKKVCSILRLAKLFSRLPFKQYTHQAFEDYISRLYQNEVNAYQPLNGPPKLAKKAYLWGIEQLAPTILTDGCWLQDINQLTTYTNPAVSGILFKIYSDEIGAGVLVHNHPYIYQQLLDSLSINLPPIDSREFIKYPGFITGAFDIPVYLLAIGKFSSSFLPELLGLNMAIELSGLGKVYLSLAEELRFWGINPAIVNVHISIDNVSSGHAALARRAIQLYLDDILACHGEREMQRCWQRIYTGYCSLQIAGVRFKLALITNYLLKRITD
jgi:hypothetical protein